jgi:HD-GYP domain-containing protein (c-di-GMP phosphodiesterase class II)
MVEPVFPLPRDELKEFLQSLSRITGLSLAFVPAGGDLQDLIIGETSFCLQVKASGEGSLRCKAFYDSLVAMAVQKGEIEFDLCHARMAVAAVSIISEDGIDYGTVIMGQAVMESLSVEHKDHIRRLSLDLNQGNADQLLAAAAQSPVFTRSRLELLGRFIRHELLEKINSYGAIEDTTEYLFQKYEELMFLYAVTESLSPDSGHQKALAVILDKGVQKLSARWGLSAMIERERGLYLEVLDSCGVLPWPERLEPGERLLEIVRDCHGPCLVLGPGFREVALVPGTGDILIVPFRLRNDKEGFLIFGWERKGMIGDQELRFAMALSNQAASVLHAVQLYRDLADLLFATLGALSSAVDAKDPYTHGHSRRVAEYAVMASQAMGFNSKFITMMKIAGQLHDFGKIGVREHILTKEGRLNESEKKAMMEHPVIAAHILGRFKSFSEIVPGIRHHHEHYDGNGYPSGLKGEQIPLVGRILSVADAYDAMTTNRPYRGKMDSAAAVDELQRFSGSQFDPEIVKVFVSALRRGSNE